MLDDYLQSVSGHLRRLAWARVAGLVAISIAALTFLGAWYVRREVPTSDQLLVLRVLAGLVIAAGTIMLVRLSARSSAVAELERRVPEFGGRLETWVDAQQRQLDSSVLALLGLQVGRIAERHPSARVIDRLEWIGPIMLSAAAVVGLVALLSGQAGGWSTAAKRLWLGDLLSAGQPHIAVAPGNSIVPVGFDVIVEARAVGFDPGAMRLVARFDGGSDWQDVAMSRLSDDSFGFVFVAVGSQIDYYAQTDNVQSERYSIRVAELPRVTSVELVADYPDWTGLEPLHSSEGDIAALAGTTVEVSVQLDKPADEVYLVVDDGSEDMETAGERFLGDFAISESGYWHIAVAHEDGLARISDRFRIDAVEDQAPEIVYVWPGRDRQATAIEEVSMEFSATDDFAVENMTVNYSVNGGAWKSHDLDVESPDWLLALEETTTVDGASLSAGDVVSLYATVSDHAQTVRSDLYFLDIRPFDRRYRESQQNSSSQGSGGDQLDIAERQKEIITATWNLANKAQEEVSDELDRETSVVAVLQEKLAEQVQVLIERASARGLDQDDSVAEFVESLDLALTEMAPAAQRLGDGQLEEALPPEQRALAHLRAAEASVRDINVSLAERSRGQGTLSNSLSELVDLEMDRERNRYETPQAANPGAAAQEQDPEWQQLEELAARQEQLAQERARGDENPASRWQQQKLERELEALREQLQRRQAASRQRPGSMSERSLGDAIADLEQASERLQQNRNDPEASREIGQALKRAADSLKQQAASDVRDQLQDARQTARALQDAQEGIMDRLEANQERSLDASEAGEFDPWQDFTMAGDVTTKAQMREDLQVLRKQLADAVNALGEDQSAAELLRAAQAELDEDRVDERLAASADAFEMGRPLYALGHEEIVTRSLARLNEQLETAQQVLGEGQAMRARNDPRRAVASLRQALAAARQGDGIDAEALGAVAAQTEALRLRLGEDLDASLERDRANYRARGLNSEDPELLYRLAEASLDLVEGALNASDAAGIQAQELRDSARDSAASADYFRELSDGARQ
jgi:hypothetical protein